ncbi:MAG: 5-amino-6-(D-ribitylamino)uracil--L-tyrosine 4-hydroxyphenyl transferase CofH [Acidimicrobiaceae bacterium]|nr:5-amino-6-(D-ribitylamino)uracil--L-tyrosine 4-hydroxyphenyl transferase CofH [Acidimicrobiaceae bacterium]
MTVNYSQLSTAELLSKALKIKTKQFGSQITFSPKVFIPLTMLCRDRCGYCTFAKPPAQLDAPFLTIEHIIEIASEGAAFGCTEALFTLGEKPEQKYDGAAQFLSSKGLSTTTEYLYLAAKSVLENTGLIPHINAGALSFDEYALLKEVSASQGMMIESLNPDLKAHRLAPDKTPERRITSLIDAGKAMVPFTTGILVGIGESEADRIQALEMIGEIAQQHHHIQEVIIQNFLPKPHTQMTDWLPATKEEFLRAIAIARSILPPWIHLQAPPNLSDDAMDLISAGIDDLGGISPVTIDHVNPERPWPNLVELESRLSANGSYLVPRLPIYPEFNDPKWISPALNFQITSSSDSLSYARTDSWVSGGDSEPPVLVGTISTAEPPKWTLIRELALKPRTSEITEICDAALNGELPDEDQIYTLFTARGSDLSYVAETADQLRKDISGDTVTYVANRNINYTNVCTFKCRFCAFSKGPLSLNLRGNPYLLELSEVSEKVAEADAAGATEVCLQGGIHPSFDGDYYLQIIDAVKKGSERIHIHGFSALEIHEGARRLGVDLKSYLIRCKEAGLKTLPGTAAEILDDEVRATLCPDKIKTDRWLEIHRTAHEVGLCSNITIMFGSIENTRTWAKHIVITRNLQLETHGFTEFVPLPFVHMASPIYLQKKARKGPTFREAILMHAVARISYQHLVPNIQASWVKMGIDGARQLLQAGTNDLGGTLMGENISRAAGGIHGQEFTRADFESVVSPLGRPLSQRTTLYQLVETDKL